MDQFKVHILGCGAASPSIRHLPSCQAIEYRGRIMIVDCGEGAQLSIRRARLNFSRITDIFISHLHGDHFLGLPGLLSTLALNNVGGRVTVHIFEEGAQLLRQTLELVAHRLSYELVFDILDPAGGQTIIDDHALTVKTFKLNHSAPCVGFRFDEKAKPRHIDGEAVRFYGVPHYLIDSLRQGLDYTNNEDIVIPNCRLTTDPSPSFSYAYCSDTICDPHTARAVKDVTVLYHESTYDKDCAEQAFERGHTTSVQAARIASLAHAGTLILGHFSSKYANEQPLVEQAATVFADTIAAREGMVITIGSPVTITQQYSL